MVSLTVWIPDVGTHYLYANAQIWFSRRYVVMEKCSKVKNAQTIEFYRAISNRFGKKYDSKVQSSKHKNVKYFVSGARGQGKSTM